jgi:hypothetical protein
MTEETTSATATAAWALYFGALADIEISIRLMRIRFGHWRRD